MKLNEQNIQKHNRLQINYYSFKIKSRMIPKATPYILKQVENLIKFADIKKENRILEIGCGMGRYTIPMAELGFNICGFDLTQYLLDKLKEYNNHRYNIPLYCGDIITPPFEFTNLFDVIIGFFTLHHLHDLEACFRAMWKMIKPGGKIVFLEPNTLNPLYYIQILITPDITWKGDRGIINMRRRIIFNAIERAGFSNFQITYFGFFPPFIANRSWGAAIESGLEQLPFLHCFLPFQLFKAVKKL